MLLGEPDQTCAAMLDAGYPYVSALAWWWLGDHPYALSAAEIAELWPHIIAIAVAYGALVGLGGLWLGGKNYRRLLAPQ